jgi:ammonium transporter, Amt family
MGPSINWEHFKPLLLALAVVSTLAVGLAVSPAPAQAPAETEAAAVTETPEAEATERAAEPAAEAPAPLTLESVDAKADVAALAGHNAWMLTSTALVLFMTVPGLAMFYGGLVRKKNVLSVIMQCLFLMCLMTTIWALYGYSLSFGGSNAFVGNGEFLFMKGVERTWDEAANAPADPPFPAGLVIPRSTHMLFQGMFFIITPGLICGAFAERMKFSAMVLFSILWGTFVYCPLCHWVWGGGLLAYVPAAGVTPLAGGALDFAGGTVVHISSGVSALICALMIGKRVGFGHDDMRPHNLTYTAIGAGMLWVGWFGFNAGSELASDTLTSSAFATTHFAAAAGGLAWAAYEWLTRGKPSVLGVASGLVAGLVCITPGAGFVNLMPAIIMGLAAGFVCAIACSKVKAAFGYDDSLDAFGVHGVGGTLGAILTGVFATRACWDIGALNNAPGTKLGLLEGGTVLTGQVVAVGVTWIFSIVATVIILSIINATIGLRVTEQQERIGLDMSQHEEEGYIFS